MPELPEVETIVRQLRPKIVGRKITAIDIIDSKVFDPNLKSLVGRRFKFISRRAKSIIMELDDGRFILTHLRMTGHFHHVAGTYPGDYKRFLTGSIRLDDDSLLTFNEIRKFGSMKLLDKEKLEKALSNLGPEPLEMKEKDFLDLCQKFPSSRIKTRLVDQSFLAGIGNIYAQEVLYYSGINPEKKISEIPPDKLVKLFDEIKRVLQWSIGQRGSTVDNYANLEGKGNFQNYLVVYNKQKCPQDHDLLKKNVGGRGTSFCAVCQN